MDYDDEDFNLEQLAQAVGDLALHAATARDYVGVAVRDARRCINIATDARLDGGVISGRALDDLLRTLFELEHDLSRAEGELAE